MSQTAYDLDRTRSRPMVDRAQAFRDAGRHSSRVRLLRRGIVAGSALLVAGVVGWSLFGPSGKLPAGVTIAGASLNGTRIIMELPKLNGYRRDGRPFEVRARSGVQDVRTPKIIELNEIDATVQNSDGAPIRIIAPKGIFDSGADTMRLDGPDGSEPIRITGASYDIVMRSADMDFKKGAVTSADPVTVKMTNGVVSADTLDITGNGSVVSFVGNVRSVIAPDRTVRLDGAQTEGDRQ